MMTTSLLTVGLPMVVGDYGVNSQFDVITFVDQEKFITMNRNSPISGFNIDAKGNIHGIINFISLLKVANSSL